MKTGKSVGNVSQLPIQLRYLTHPEEAPPNLLNLKEWKTRLTHHVQCKAVSCAPQLHQTLGSWNPQTLRSHNKDCVQNWLILLPLIFQAEPQIINSFQKTQWKKITKDYFGGFYSSVIILSTYYEKSLFNYPCKLIHILTEDVTLMWSHKFLTFRASRKWII